MSQRFELESNDGRHGLVLHQVAVDEPSAGSLVLPRRPTLAPIWDTFRASAVELVTTAVDVSALLSDFRRRNPGRGDKEIFARIVVPREAHELVVDGKWSFRDAVDGRGKLPWVADEAGTIRHQVRLQDVKTGQLRTDDGLLGKVAAGQAMTHLQLRHISAQLEAIEGKLDDVLMNDKFDWWSEIEHGIDEMLSEPSWSSDAPFMAVVRGSISKGVHRGWHHVDRTARRIAEIPNLDWGEAWRAVNEKRLPVPSARRRASLLDELRLDLAVVARGTEALVAIDEANGNFDRAAQRTSEFQRRLRKVHELVGLAHRRAHYSPERESFWAVTMPSLGESRPSTPPQLEVAVDLGSIVDAAQQAPRSRVVRRRRKK